MQCFVRSYYVNGFVTRYHIGLAVGVEDALPYAPHQESCIKDLQWPYQQLVEVKATAVKHLG